MFHLYITLAYIIPNIYVFFRVRKLFIDKKYIWWYVFIYLFIALIYPLSERFSNQDANLFLRIISVVSGYILPFFLYFFLCIFLFDLFLLINRWAKMISVEMGKSFSFRVYTLSSMILLSILVVVGGAINLNSIRVSKYEISVSKKNSGIDDLRIVFVADMHINKNLNLHFVEQFVRKANALKPDIMLYGGDMLEGDRENESTRAIDSLLKTIRTRYGSYGVLGNHEFYGGDESDGFFKKAGIILLNDTIVNIDHSFSLAGRVDQHYRKRKSIETILKVDTLQLPIILMDHRPTELQEVSRTEADVQFSGHTHNGQLFPINLIVKSMYELAWGYEKIGDTHFFVTSGLRLWGPPVKTAGKSEIMLVDIHFE